MFRIHHEMKAQQYPGWFITLTYNEKYVRRLDDGRLSLRFRDVQLFLKRLRRAKHYAKYICVGEYGGQTQRPHYHMLLWTDCDPCKLEHYWSVQNKQNVLEPMGGIHVGRISMQSAMYTLKYIIQPKVKIDDGRERTRAQFSKGLGLDYLTRAVYDYHTFDYDAPVLMSVVDGRKVALPRYYRYKIFTKYQLAKEAHKVKWESIRKRRRHMRQLIALGVKDTKSYMHALRIEQCNRIIEKTKSNTQSL